MQSDEYPFSEIVYYSCITHFRPEINILTFPVIMMTVFLTNPQCLLDYGHYCGFSFI